MFPKTFEEHLKSILRLFHITQQHFF